MIGVFLTIMIKIETCKRCLYDTNHPLGLVIDNDGICSGCRIHEEKNTLDWEHRWQLLERLVKDYRCKDKRNYDCIIPVSGGMDSYFIVHTVKEILGLNPLLVTYNKYWNTPLGVRNLANLRIRFNCDILTQNVNPHSVKKTVKTTLRSFGSIYWHCIAGQTVFPVQVAVRKKIPLIIWGAHQGMEQVGMFSHEHEVEMTRRYRKDHDLMGFEADDLLSDFDVLSERDIWQYRYPEDQEINSIGVRGIYLNNYVRWDPKAQHELMIKKYGYETSKFNRTFDCYDFVDCYNYMNLHDVIKYYKTGISKVMDHATREIRHGRLSKKDALGLVAYHQTLDPSYIDMFCEWLGINQRSLQYVLDTHRNKDIWEYDDDRNWILKNKVDIVEITQESKFPTNSPFKENSSLSRDIDDEYITIGKGYP
jgi:N-acetyl sugar amidotransferase